MQNGGSAGAIKVRIDAVFSKGIVCSLKCEKGGWDETYEGSEKWYEKGQEDRPLSLLTWDLPVEKIAQMPPVVGISEILTILPQGVFLALRVSAD